jgi:competence ComEA-like helix-hairpin-helix protein
VLTPETRKALLLLVGVMGAVVLARRGQSAQSEMLSKPRSQAVAAVQSTGEGAALRDGRRLDPNRASADELELLPGVGPSLARRLVEERGRSGPFRSAPDLRRVPGVGERTLAKLLPFLRFDSEQVEHAAHAQLHVGDAGDVPRFEQDAGPNIEAHGPSARP